MTENIYHVVIKQVSGEGQLDSDVYVTDALCLRLVQNILALPEHRVDNPDLPNKHSDAGFKIHEINIPDGSITPIETPFLKAVKSTQNTVPCSTCGVAMEDRGAEKQWCKECWDSRTKTSEDQ